MKDINIISVNPSASATSILHEQGLKRIARRCRTKVSAKPLDILRLTISSIFGINKSVTSGWSAKLWIIRSAVAIFLVVYGFAEGASFRTFGIHEIEVITGLIMIPGIFTRLAAITASVVFMITLYPAIVSLTPVEFINDTTAMTSIVAATLCAVTALLGPGRYSIDQILRRAMLKAIDSRRIAAEQRAIRDRMSYKAWRTV